MSNKCKYCGTDRNYANWKSKTECRRCYNVASRMKKVQNWNYNDPNDTDKYLEKIPYEPKSKDEFEEIRDSYVRRFKEKLDIFKIIEKKMNRDVMRLDIEYFITLKLIELFPPNRRKTISVKFNKFADRLTELNQVELNATYRILVVIWEMIKYREEIYPDFKEVGTILKKYQ